MSRHRNMLDEAIARGKREIARDMRAGRVPPDTVTFASLHDFVDANEYGGLCDDDFMAPFINHDDPTGPYYTEAAYALSTQVQDALDGWLKEREGSNPCGRCKHPYTIHGTKVYLCLLDDCDCPRWVVQP